MLRIRTKMARNTREPLRAHIHRKVRKITLKKRLKYLLMRKEHVYKLLCPCSPTIIQYDSLLINYTMYSMNTDIVISNTSILGAILKILHFLGYGHDFMS